ncbi:MAG: calcium/sodium antiporter [bacterium]
MIVSLLLILTGLILLIAGGECVVRGGSSVAARLRVPEFLIGATVVAFGTSAPELAVTVTAALRGAPELALGNVVGSNIANLGLILGLAALLRPVIAPVESLKNEIWAIAGVIVLLVLFGWNGQVSRIEGIILLAGMAAAMIHSVRGAHKARALGTHDNQVQHYKTIVAVPILLAGLVLLYFGGQVLVDGAVRIAEAFGVPQWVIGALIVAVGTSTPEVAASVVAAWRGRGDLAVGNVIGSNLFNTFFVLGTGATIRPFIVNINIHFDLILFAGMSVLAVAVMLLRKRLSRTWGGILLMLYVAYVVIRILLHA